MRNTVLTALASVLLAAALGLLLWPRQEAQAQHPAPKGWEYRFVDVDVAMPSISKEGARKKAGEEGAESFNRLGADGWEPVLYQPHFGYFVFKRPKR